MESKRAAKAKGRSLKRWKMPKLRGKARVSVRTRRITAAASVASASLFAVIAFLLWPEEAFLFSNEIFLVFLLVVMLPSAVLDFVNQRWIDAIEAQMPVLVSGVSEIQETGLTFVKAFDKIVENRMVHPPLSEEVKTLTVHMSWGLTFEDALRKFKERIGSPVVSRFCALILEASHSGGQIRKVFSATSSFMEEMKEIDRETSSQMRPYLIIIYTAFFVFVFTSIILLSAFFVPLEGYTQIISPVTMIGPREFRDFFYRTMLVSGLLGGIMAGKMGERRAAAGLKHAIILIVAGYITFYIFIPPNWVVMK